jgi:hypothetical protein
MAMDHTPAAADRRTIVIATTRSGARIFKTNHRR